MSGPKPLPGAADAVVTTVWRVLGSVEWARAVGDRHERTWLLTSAVCEALYAEGIERVPGASGLQRCLDRMRRDDDILGGFNGKNYEELARRHRLSSRTVRRIIERARKQRAGRV